MIASPLIRCHDARPCQGNADSESAEWTSANSCRGRIEAMYFACLPHACTVKAVRDRLHHFVCLLENSPSGIRVASNGVILCCYCSCILIPASTSSHVRPRFTEGEVFFYDWSLTNTTATAIIHDNSC